MNDNDIVKALECCANADCLNCPRWSGEWTSGMCADFLPSVLGLINRQQAEIERLEAMIDAAEEHFSPLPFKNKFDEYIKKNKSEAIKEFAERLKSRTRRMIEYDEGGWDCTRYAIDDEGIDNLVKEMTEDENDG